MSVYIKDMDMPTDCLACRIACDKENYGVIGRPPKCPLAEAAAGDLINRAEAIEAVRKEYEDAINIGDNGDAIAYDVGRILSALPSAEAVQGEIVHCKDCRWYDNRYGDVCHNPRYGDGHANYAPPYVDDDYWCKDGERKGGDTE